MTDQVLRTSAAPASANTSSSLSLHLSRLRARFAGALATQAPPPARGGANLPRPGTRTVGGTPGARGLARAAWCLSQPAQRRNILHRVDVQAQDDYAKQGVQARLLPALRVCRADLPH